MLFDLDDTLYDHAYASRAALNGIRETSSVLRRVPRADLWARYDALLDELHPLVLAGKLHPSAARTERFRRLFATFGDSLDGDALEKRLRAYRTLYRSHQRAVPGAVALLRRLHREATVVIVSNNLQEEQETKLAAVELAPFVDLLVTSERVGAPKPDPRIFRHAVREAGLERRPVVVVGDSWTADVEGARAAGLPVLWFNRSHRSRPSGEPVPELATLRPAESVVAAIRTQAGPGSPRRRA